MTGRHDRARRLRRLQGMGILAATALLLAACNPFAPGVPLSGAWSGTYEHSDGDESGVLLLELEVTGASVGGSWESSLPGPLDSGAITGEVGPLIMLELVSDADATCRFQLLAEQRDDLLVGGYMSDCGDVPNGWIELEKR